MFAGQMACEALNWVLKRYIKEERPRGKSRKGHYSSVVLILDRDAWKGLRNAFLTRPVRILLLRYLRPVSPLPTRSPPDGYPHALLTGWPFPPFTPSIGLCRSAAGAIFALAWFAFTTYLRRAGWIEWALETWVLRTLRVRDLVIQEDLVDSGWARWEDRRKRQIFQVQGKKSR